MRLPPAHLIPGLHLSDGRLSEAAARFGTPLYLYDCDRIGRDFAALESAVPKGFEILYSVKANPSQALIRELSAHGAGFEFSSPGELNVLRAAGVDLGRSIYVGPGKSGKDLKEAVHSGVGLVVLESERELYELEIAGQSLGKDVRALLRINPGPSLGEQQMAGATQFGMGIPEAREALFAAKSLRRVRITGIHGFLGTRLFDAKSLGANAAAVLKAAALLEESTGETFETVDLGGGFGVPLYAGESELDCALVREELEKLTDSYLKDHPWTKKLLVESGRYLVARCGVFLTRVLDVKVVGERAFAILDGGVHAIGGRDGFIGARPTPLKVVGGQGRRVAEITLCGPLCTPADRLAARIMLPQVFAGDLVALFMAGAYGLTASAGFFLSRGFPAEAVSKDGTLRLEREKLTIEALLMGVTGSKKEGSER